MPDRSRIAAPVRCTVASGSRAPVLVPCSAVGCVPGDACCAPSGAAANPRPATKAAAPRALPNALSMLLPIFVGFRKTGQGLAR
jgi:hypothetical protein